MGLRFEIIPINMTDREPSGYQFKHSTQISMDGYSGIASGLMELNDPVADGFMKVSDMRYPIHIVSPQVKRTYDYDQVGRVRVAKMLQIPRIGTLYPDGTMSTRKEGDAWIVKINDRKIWDNIRDSEGRNNGSNEDQFVERFKKEARRGLRECLGEEKIFNASIWYSYIRNLNYIGTGLTYLLVAINEIETIMAGVHTLEVDTKAAILAVTGNMVFNLTTWTLAATKSKGGLLGLFTSPAIPDYEEPFVRHHPLEFVMPPVPVDRLVRGLAYDAMHGNQLITKVA